jgi:transposase
LVVSEKMCNFASMIDERAYELALSQLAQAREEKMLLFEQVKRLTEEVAMLRSSSSSQADQQAETIRELTSKISEMSAQVEKLNGRIDHLNEVIQMKDEVIRAKDLQIKNLKNEVANGRSHRFNPTTEQRDLLNNRSSDTEGERKLDFDGTPESLPPDPEQPNDDDSDGVAPKKQKRKKETQKRQPKQPHKVDETITHEVDEYYDLPEGARFICRDGEMEICYYRVIEHIKARNVEHIYKVARVQLADGSFTNTMEDPKKKIGGIFGPTLLAQVLCWKYVYHLSANRIKKMLRNQGIYISKASLNRYMQNGMRLLREYLEEPFKLEVQATDYMMTDETAELVGVVEDGVKSYKKRYLWAFFAKLKNMVFYVYEKGSRARKVALEFLKNFCGFLSTDGYVAYSIFDDAEKYPEIVHIGCWVHCRRKYIEALPTDERAREIINLIAELFKEEVVYKVLNLKPWQIKKRRKKRSKAILNKIHSKVLLMSLDVGLMANEMMKKAVTYTLSQWKSLENFVEDGRVEISNNLCEQRMKAVKLNLKNCQNIGSEFAAENAAFMFSVTESCSLNGINPESYLEDVFRSILFGTNKDKRDFLPCHYQAHELPKMTGLEVAQLLSTAA